MRIRNWRRNLAATLVAVGLLTPSAARAANLNENLVIDPGFENVDEGITCCYLSAATKLNSWSDGTVTGFAYNNELPELNGSGDLGWDDGGPLQGGGKYFFGAGGTDSPDSPPPITIPGEVAQNINVGTGASGTLIASGEAAVVLSGFFTSYNGQSVRGSMQVDFLNSGGTALGSTVITARNPTPWHQERGAAAIPVGTVTLRTSLFGDNFNAYIDNVDVRVVNAADALIRGDFNADGDVNSLDWVILRTNQEADLSGLSIEAAYRRGDLTEDLANDHEDFVVFKNLYDAANGTGAFVAMQSAVPEPSTLMLTAAGGFVMLSAARRRRAETIR